MASNTKKAGQEARPTQRQSSGAGRGTRVVCGSACSTQPRHHQPRQDPFPSRAAGCSPDRRRQGAGARTARRQERGQRRNRHQPKSEASHRIPCAGRDPPPRHAAHGRQQNRNQRALPQEMHKRPTRARHPWLLQYKLDRAHWDLSLFSNSFNRRRISARSSSEAGCAFSAPSTRFAADPPKARRSRSPAICCCVSSLGAPAS